ncbi:protein-disulfide reductase DsbD family protein [Rurimicrobium arvi]|uniref:Cytochrome c biogenesis protein CcdA n=1 Tax=Rurimicrobium arvi TaxID=2049916 RepID=A0ABP8MSX5_9BACT
MTRLIRFCAFALTLLLSLNGMAEIVKDPTTWTFEVSRKSEGKYELTFHLKLSEHWHIWSINPGGDGLQLPPSFKFKKDPSVKLIGKIRESGKRITETMDGVDGPVSYFLNKVDYIQTVEVTKNGMIKGEWTYQVCDESMCLPPTTKDFSFTIDDPALASADTARTVLNDTGNVAVASVQAPATPSGNTPADTAKQAGTEDKKEAGNPVPESLWLIFLGGLGAGLAAVVTPCIYSMIPITVSFFTKKSKDRKTGITNALVYSFSIIFIFAILGMAIIAIFGANALNSLSTHWIPNLIFFAIFLLFAFSFLGAFELTLPSSWTSRVDSKANTNSYSGIFFMALTLVIVSFSCTSAFIGGIAVLAAKGGFWGPLVGFSSFGLGIAFPFALFAMFPSYLKNLEKPGGWQNAVKVTLGFIELALALKFLSNADLAKGWRLLDREIFIGIWVVLSILLGMYLLGKLRFSHDDDLPKNMFGIPYVSVPRLLLAISAFSFAIYLVPGMWGAPLKAVSSFVPPMGTQDFIATGGSAPAAHAVAEGVTAPSKYVEKLKIYEPEAAKKFGLVTYYDLEEAKAAAKILKKPLMLDFTGINCINCRKMEGQVWSDPEVMKRMKEDFVVVSLYVDFNNEELPEAQRYVAQSGSKITTVGNKNADYQVTRFGSNAQPLYFFVDVDDHQLAEKGYPYDPNIDKFIAHLDAVKAKYKELNP